MILHLVPDSFQILRVSPGPKVELDFKMLLLLLITKSTLSTLISRSLEDRIAKHSFNYKIVLTHVQNVAVFEFILKSNSLKGDYELLVEERSEVTIAEALETEESD